VSNITFTGVLLFACLATAQGSADPLQLLLDAYAADVADIRSREVTPTERLEHRRNWLDRFASAISEHPDSPNRRAATAKAIGLANGVGDTELSAALSAQLMDSSTELGEKVFWLVEHGETLLRAHHSGGDDQDLNMAIQSLKRSLTLVQENQNIIHPDVRSRAVIGGASLVKSLVDSKGISSEEASDLLNQLALISDALPGDVLKRLQASGFGNEGLTISLLRVAIAMGDQELANVALEKLFGLSKTASLKSHFSSHVLLFARKQWPQGGRARQEFVLRWALRASDDPWRAFLYFDVASNAEADGNCESVIQYGEMLLGETGNALREADRKKKAGGKYMDSVLGMLADCYKAQGMDKKLIDATDRLKSEHPESERLKRLERATSGSAKKKTRATSTEDTAFLILNGLALGGVLVCLVASLIRKWRSNKSQ